MANAEQLRALIDNFTTGDAARFRAVTLEIAARFAKQGKTQLAAELREQLDKPGRTRIAQHAPLAPLPLELAGLLAVSYPEARLDEMVLTEDLHTALAGVVHEYRHRDRLWAHGVRPKQRLLWVGPPGCGKTMAASVLASECRLPLMFVQLRSLMPKHLGEAAAAASTAATSTTEYSTAKLQLIFEVMERTPGVYLFDEFEAIAAVPEANNTAGAARKILAAFLHFLEKTKSDSIVVAATHLLKLSDETLFQRFDAVLHYPLPDDAAIVALLENRLALFDTDSVAWKDVTHAGAGLCHADVLTAAEQAAKDWVLDEHATIMTLDLKSELNKRRASL